MILRGVLVALGFAVGLALLIRRVLKTEVSIIKDDEDALVELKTYPSGHDSIMIDEMLLRGAGIPFIKRNSGYRSSTYVVISVTPALLDKARTALAKVSAE